ncbi:hypothetical protein BDW22DRAFT_720859 [Trametopsis cervina]|nr:hypothetical protein BDW22DRAFT_720859 [Trametopsis cervina]
MSSCNSLAGRVIAIAPMYALRCMCALYAMNQRDATRAFWVQNLSIDIVDRTERIVRGRRRHVCPILNMHQIQMHFQRVLLSYAQDQAPAPVRAQGKRGSAGKDNTTPSKPGKNADGPELAARRSTGSTE